jgi:hypothetical protein
LFKQYYKDRFREIFGAPPSPSDGLGDTAVRAELGRIGFVIPKALFDYYSLAGRHWINENHNHLRTIANLEWVDDKLIFMEENQCVVFWGIDKSDLRQTDPVVWQAANDDPVEWFAENYRLSQFLMAMWKWIVTGEQEPPTSGRGGA